MIQIKTPEAVLIRPNPVRDSRYRIAREESGLTLLCFSNWSIRDSMFPDEKRWGTRGLCSGVAMVGECEQTLE